MINLISDVDRFYNIQNVIWINLYQRIKISATTAPSNGVNDYINLLTYFHKFRNMHFMIKFVLIHNLEERCFQDLLCNKLILSKMFIQIYKYKRNSNLVQYKVKKNDTECIKYI